MSSNHHYRSKSGRGGRRGRGRLGKSMSDTGSKRQTAGSAAFYAENGPSVDFGIVSAGDVIRESFASSRASSFFDYDDVSRSTRASSYGSQAYDPTRRSTLLPTDDELPEEVDFYDEDEVDLESDYAQSEYDDDDDDGDLLSIKNEPEGKKIFAAKQRWAQQAKLKATTFTKTTGRIAAAAAAASAASFPLKKTGESSGTTTLQKWNRWIQDQYQNKKNHVSLGKILELSKQKDSMDTFHPDGDVTSSPISLEEVISNPRMIRYYASWLEVEEQSKLFFLCSLDEFRNLWTQMNARTSDQFDEEVDIEQENAAVVRTFAQKIVAKYLEDDAPFHIGAQYVTSEKIARIMGQTQVGGENVLRVFDEIGLQAKMALMCRFPEFRKTDLYDELHKSVRREVYHLENILLNQRFVNFYWIFLFQHNYHREMALWLEVEYDLKPKYKMYVEMMDATGYDPKRPEIKDRVKYMIQYLCRKYYAGGEALQNLYDNIPSAVLWFQKEQATIVDKLKQAHLDLYPRFITSRAYFEFASYRMISSPNAVEQLDATQDLRRLSFILRNYGLRMHQWPDDATTESKKQHTIENLRLKKGKKSISYIVTFETSYNAEAGSIRINLNQHSLPHQKHPDPLPTGIEGFLVPWCLDLEKVYITSVTCPKPHAFNTFMVDGPTELYVACLIVYKPGPNWTREELEVTKVSGSRWVPFGVAIFSKYPLLDHLRRRITVHYENNHVDPWELYEEDVDQLATAYLGREPTAIESSISSSSMNMQELDYSLELLFETLDIATIILTFTALLLECRVLFISSQYSVNARLTETFRMLLHPLKWPHVYLPVLPGLMLQCIQCPTPFMIGCHRELLDAEILSELGDEVVCVDLDKSTVIQGKIPCTLPPRMINTLHDTLHRLLHPKVVACDSIFYDTIPSPIQEGKFPEFQIRVAFHDTIMDCIGNFGYHRYILKDELSQERAILFDEASYLAASSTIAREFRTIFVSTQALSEYLTSRNGFVKEMT